MGGRDAGPARSSRGLPPARSCLGSKPGLLPTTGAGMATSTVSVPGNPRPQVLSGPEYAPREGLSYRVVAPQPRGLCGGVRDQAMEQDPMTRVPNAALSVVPGKLRAHSRETVSPPPWGGGAEPEVEPDSLPCPPPGLLGGTRCARLGCGQESTRRRRRGESLP